MHRNDTTLEKYSICTAVDATTASNNKFHGLREKTYPLSETLNTPRPNLDHVYFEPCCLWWYLLVGISSFMEQAHNILAVIYGLPFIAWKNLDPVRD